jgi:hypothetical protein
MSPVGCVNPESGIPGKGGSMAESLQNPAPDFFMSFMRFMVWLWVFILLPVLRAFA